MRENGLNSMAWGKEKKIRTVLGLCKLLRITIGNELPLRMKMIALLTIWHSYESRLNIFE
jgi:hypothetical protein